MTEVIATEKKEWSKFSMELNLLLGNNFEILYRPKSHHLYEKCWTQLGLYMPEAFSPSHLLFLLLHSKGLGQHPHNLPHLAKASPILIMLTQLCLLQLLSTAIGDLIMNPSVTGVLDQMFINPIKNLFPLYHFLAYQNLTDLKQSRNQWLFQFSHFANLVLLQT